LSPGFSVEGAAGGLPRLRLEGGAEPHVFGGWRRVVPVSGGQSYRLQAHVEKQAVTRPREQVVCQVRWQGQKLGEDVAPEYAAGCNEVVTAPLAASGAEVSLLLQWAAGASLAFSEVVFEPVPSPLPRPVGIATLYWRPHKASTPIENINAFSALIDRVGPRRPDVVLLSEATTSIGTGLTVSQAAQEPTGAAFQALAGKAHQYGTYIVYGAYERAGDIIYNTAFIIGRDGRLVGRHRKVQLPVGEVEAGLSAGDAYGTFDLDFGRVGILICHDAAFDEPARILALAGARLLLVPAWGADLTQIRARALDNGVWVVTAGYDVPSAVIDPAGEIHAQTWKDLGDGTAIATIDLARPVFRPWVGDWHSAALKQRRPDAYRSLLEEPR
jgi:predicted amidohydrolase